LHFVEISSGKIANNVRVLSISTDYLVLALGSDLLIKRKIKVFDIEYIILIKQIAILFLKKSTMLNLSRPSPAVKKLLQASNHHIGCTTRKNTKETWINNSFNDNIRDPSMTRQEEADESERQWQLIDDHISFHSSDESESETSSMVAFDDEASLFSSSSSYTMKKKRKHNRSWKRRLVLVSYYLSLRRKNKVGVALNVIDHELYDIACL
jgi:hypothetical protein